MSGARGRENQYSSPPTSNSTRPASANGRVSPPVKASAPGARGVATAAPGGAAAGGATPGGATTGGAVAGGAVAGGAVVGGTVVGGASSPVSVQVTGCTARVEKTNGPSGG